MANHLNDWSWKPQDQDTPKRRRRRNNERSIRRTSDKILDEIARETLDRELFQAFMKL